MSQMRMTLVDPVSLAVAFATSAIRAGGADWGIVPGETTVSCCPHSLTLSGNTVADTPFQFITQGKPAVLGFALHAGPTARRRLDVSLERSVQRDPGEAAVAVAKQ